MDRQEKNSVPISIIIPVYNVKEWLDQCMESVVNQTFPDFEVILINDGSTDDSDIKCQEWQRKDERILYFSKENEGLSPTRNLGIQKANGEYIVFIDSDDWVDLTFVEKLYDKAIQQNADIVECDIWRYNDINGKMTYNSCYGSMGREYSLQDHIKYGNSAIWKCMIRKELFIKNDIMFPDCHSPARAVYALLLLLSKKNVSVHEGLYFYRRYRKGSLSEKPKKNGGDENSVGIRAFEHLIYSFKKLDLYDDNQELLEAMIKYRLSDLLAAFFPRKDKTEFGELTEKYYEFIHQKFPNGGNYKYITFGSYNLNRILWHMNLLHDPYCRFNFSSVISLMNPINEEFPCRHKNRYREIMLEREIKNQFWDILDEIKPEYIFIDFIEERFDMIAYQGGYLTKSDAFVGSEFVPENMSVLSRDGQVCQELWKKSCQQFIDRLKEHYPLINIVLIKNYLSEKVGDVYSQSEYENIEEIQKINGILKEYYHFFESNCKRIIVIEASECNYYFTDRQYEYGAIPSHLNEIVNEEIAKKIEEVIGL